jgi:hypothetical protein
VVEAVDAARAAGDRDRIPLLFGQDAGLITSIEATADVVESVVRAARDALRAPLTG